MRALFVSDSVCYCFIPHSATFETGAAIKITNSFYCAHFLVAKFWWKIRNSCVMIGGNKSDFFGRIFTKIRCFGFTKHCLIKKLLPKNVKSPIFRIWTVNKSKWLPSDRSSNCDCLCRMLILFLISLSTSSIISLDLITDQNRWQLAIVSVEAWSTLIGPWLASWWSAIMSGDSSEDELRSNEGARWSYVNCACNGL